MKKIVLLAFSCLSLGSILNAQTANWQPTNISGQVNYAAYGFKIDKTAVKASLLAVGTSLETSGTIALPNPQGKVEVYKVWRNSLIPAELQGTFPDVWSFTASSTTEKGKTAKLEFSPRGLYVMVFDGAATYVIEPVSNSENSYKSYFKNDAPRDPMNGQSVCSFDNSMSSLTGTEPVQLKTASFTLGAIKRTYRLALSCTGEYAVAVGGATPTAASVFAAMTTTMNRVNGIYERELGVTLQFVSNNNLLVYIDPATDPFTANNNGSTLLGQNQTNTTTVIGNANYDIGHIFSTGGGGIAFLGCVCKTNQKARGVTGSPNPVGDPFDVDYVCHEMGHQFGADHSFNTCSGTENQSTAYEPGSGSTIMGYAGICGVNDLQNQSDDYFHRTSLFEINSAMASTTGPGSCPTTTTGYDAPTFTVSTTSYRIPKKTPFELDFPSVTPLTSGNPVKMIIDENDLGDFQVNESISAIFTDGPQFRSFLPDTISRRSFPRYVILKAGITDVVGERLSDVGRLSKFSYTAREIQADGWGAINSSGTVTSINVESGAGPFKILFPNAQDSLMKNAANTVHWDVANSSSAPINCANVDIFLSTDAGLSFPIVLATNVPNSGHAVVNIPDIESNFGRVKVKGADNVFFAFSRSNVIIGTSNNDTITTPVGLADFKTAKSFSVFPNPVQSLLTISFNDLNVKGVVVLVNTLGQEVYKGEIENGSEYLKIDVTNFARGVYLAKFVNSEGTQYTHKILIN